MIITQQLIEQFDQCEDFFKGLAGYIFRRHFEEVFKNVADLILVEISVSNEYMINFLKYYSQNIIVINGERYEVPSLKAHNSLKWNAVSMLSIIKLYVKTRSKATALKDEINKIETNIIDLY